MVTFNEYLPEQNYLRKSWGKEVEVEMMLDNRVFKDLGKSGLKEKEEELVKKYEEMKGLFVECLKEEGVVKEGFDDLETGGEEKVVFGRVVVEGNRAEEGNLLLD